MSKYRRKSKDKTGIIGLILIILLIIYLLLNNTKTKDDLKVSNINGYDAIVIVVGNVANSPVPNIANDDMALSAISDIFYNTEGGKIPNISIISAAGMPKSIAIDKKYLLGPANNAIASKSNLDMLIKGINQAISSSPSSAGADYIEAILNAGDYIKDYQNPLVIVYGSGLSDTGILNFAFKDLIIKRSNDENYILNLLIQNKNIIEKKFNGLHLVWFGCGQGIDRQPDLKEWKNLVEIIYQDVFDYLGINGNFKTIPITANTKSVATDYDVNITSVDDIPDGYTVNLTDRFVVFKPDSDVIVNAMEANELLQSFASKLKNTNLKLNITGYQTVCANSETLGYLRAEAVKRILVNLGLDENNIRTKGVAGPPDDREEKPRCGNTGVASEHRTIRLEVINSYE